MRVLFIGEGKHEVGPPEFNPQPRQAKGVIPLLVNRVSPIVDSDSIAYAWRQIPVLNKETKMRGLAAKVRSASVLAYKHECSAMVCVHDKDRDESRLAAMEEGSIGTLPIICAIAKESIEAWTLGAPSALAEVLKVPLPNIRKCYSVAKVEDLYQNSNKPEKRPKDVLEKVAQLGHKLPDAEFRELVAERTNIGELEANCPLGFKPFVAKLRGKFGTEQ